MSVIQPALEALGDHDYLVRFQQDELTVVVRVHADPAVVKRVGDDEQRVVEATAAYLIARQGAEDLPEQVDLDAVAAAYDGYVEDLHRQLTPPSPHCGPDSPDGQGLADRARLTANSSRRDEE